MSQTRQGRWSRNCEGVNRRDVLRAGVLSALGLGLPDLLRMQAARAAASGKPAREMSCILIYQAGGPSHLETFDLKPDAPADMRGDFRPIETNVKGIRICEHLPRLARVTDRFSILRSVTHTNAGHGGGAHYMCTGKHPAAGFTEGLTRPNNQHPFFGSVVARARGVRGELPPYISVPMLLTYGGPAFLGPAHMPFVIASDPASPSFSVRDLRPAPGVAVSRADERRKLRAALDEHGQASLAKGNPRVAAMDTFYQKAHGLITSEAALRAFDISKEPENVRDRYGRHSFGQSVLMARRLVEAGCRFVSVDHGGWDNHTTIFTTMKNDLLPQIDSGVSSLLQDLSDRGLLDSTLVVMFGEFGRTAKINKEAGRDHWPNSVPVMIAGGGIRNGIVVGATDARGEEPSERPIKPEDLAATIYSCLGVDYRSTVETPLGRPVPIVVDGERIRELF